MASTDRVTQSPCCRHAIYYARGEHGVSIGSCGKCGDTVSRVNPRTGLLEWLEGHHPDFEGALRPIYQVPHHAAAAGFTIIEFLIIVAMVGIVAAIAIPSYLRAKDSIRRRQSGVVTGVAAQPNPTTTPSDCLITKAAPDTWMFACSAQPFARAFFAWRTEHPELRVQRVIPFAYRSPSDTEVLVITNTAGHHSPVEREERR
jgi:hypothetical protein